MSRVINHPNHTDVVPSRSLAAVLRREIERLDSIFAFEKQNGNNAHAERFGAVDAISKRAALYHGRNTQDAMARRLNDIVNDRVAATAAHTADCLLMACDLNIERDCPEILTLPAGLTAALDRVRVHMELRGMPDWFIEQYAEELAEDLLEFSFTVILDGTEALDGPLKTTALKHKKQKAAKKRLAARRRRRQLAQVAA